ncbi:MAG: 4-(cytidine 5'-diphospho)-2-C-methyl-D-erythritol kinase [Calditrichaeota bacterium]|nr:MAG: 4-(cytidine 5'-diphospho)-2-C-methyl-D-erythritol kinase [Calditrichota bacterium]
MFVKNITNKQITIQTPAKINLFLEVLNKRQDGFHNINSLFQAISLYDTLTISKSQTPGINLKVLGDKGILPVDSNNLIIKAYNLMREKFSLETGVEVELQKEIPIAAGLAGGSSDAAAMLTACNIMYNLELSKSELAELGLELGSDIPFFFSSGQCLVTGRGEFIEETDYPVDYELVIVKPTIAFSTAESYAMLKRDLTKVKNPFKLGSCRTKNIFLPALGNGWNDFEKVHLLSHPEIAEIKDGLLGAGASLARMSGSGPCVFGIFERIPNDMDVLLKGKNDWKIWKTNPVTLTEQETKNREEPWK